MRETGTGCARGHDRKRKSTREAYAREAYARKACGRKGKHLRGKST